MYTKFHFKSTPKFVSVNATSAKKNERNLQIIGFFLRQMGITACRKLLDRT